MYLLCCAQIKPPNPKTDFRLVACCDCFWGRKRESKFFCERESGRRMMSGNGRSSGLSVEAVREDAKKVGREKRERARKDGPISCIAASILPTRGKVLNGCRMDAFRV